MNILVYTSSLNGKEVLKQCIESLFQQSYPIKEILVVDNGSKDDTCLEMFPRNVTMICHLRNLGTSGAAATAFEYALENGYDWIWVLDQDTDPKPDALEKMVQLYESFDATEQEKVGVISSTVILHPTNRVIHGRKLTPGGVRPTVVKPGSEYYHCDATIWSGSLYNLKAVREVGMPRHGMEGCWEDLALDYGDLEYSYRVKQAGYSVLGHMGSIIIHPVGKARHLKFFSHTIYSTNHSPFRRYLYFRNMVYFWFYLYRGKNHAVVLVHLIFRFMANNIKVLVMEKDRWRKIAASVYGIWHGLKKDLHKKVYYSP